MAEKSDSQEKTEEATQKKLDESKKKGSAARSKELVVLAMLMVSSFIIFAFGPGISQQINTGLVATFTFDDTHAMDKSYLFALMEKWGMIFIDVLTPVLIVTLVMAVMSSIALGGWVMSMSAVAPKLEKISFAKGMKRIFSSKGGVEFVKAVMKSALIGAASYFLFKMYLPDITVLSTLNNSYAANSALEMLGWFFFLSSSALLVVVFIDVPFQLWSHKKELMMSKQDIRDEMKDTEGRPEVKMKKRELARKIAFSRMMDEVPEADVVVTNPTHYAVALKYNGGDNAPIVVAVGSDFLALKIRTMAKQYDVPILEAPPLARSLYYYSDIGQPIHEGLYEAVAQVLSYIYQLRDYRDHGGHEPELGDIYIDRGLRK